MENPKKIENYLHLYLGCDFKYSNEFGSFTEKVSWTTLSKISERCKNGKIILRPLSDMTEEEKSEFEVYSMQLMQDPNDYNQTERNAHKNIWYLKRKFDLFGLIDAELAIDGTLNPLK